MSVTRSGLYPLLILSPEQQKSARSTRPLASYAARIQKHMERTLVLLREVEGLSAIDV